MLHHVSLEIEPTEIEPAIEFWCLLGFTLLPAPPALADASVWLERAGTQIHLIKTAAPVGPRGATWRSSRQTLGRRSPAFAPPDLR